MSYRTLLVHLDGDARCAARVGVALQLAARYDAHLLGLAPGAVLLDRFAAQAASSGLKSFEGLLMDGGAEAAMVCHGRVSDLVIVSQTDTQDKGAAVAADFPQRVFMQTGRPVLVLPRVMSQEKLASKVLVAWNGQRESARALSDALPLLKGADKVCLLCLDRADEAVVSRLELNDLRHWLERHGISAECVQLSTSEDIGDALLMRAVGFGANLIVMGGFGHSRWTELALGCVTRTVLTTAVVPVLISH